MKNSFRKLCTMKDTSKGFLLIRNFSKCTANKIVFTKKILQASLP